MARKHILYMLIKESYIIYCQSLLGIKDNYRIASYNQACRDAYRDFKITLQEIETSKIYPSELSTDEAYFWLQILVD